MGDEEQGGQDGGHGLKTREEGWRLGMGDKGLGIGD